MVVLFRTISTLQIFFFFFFLLLRIYLTTQAPPRGPEVPLSSAPHPTRRSLLRTQEYRHLKGFLRDQFPHFGMVPATVTGYETASLGYGAGEGPEPSRWHFLYDDLAFLGGDGS